MTNVATLRRGRLSATVLLHLILLFTTIALIYGSMPAGATAPDSAQPHALLVGLRADLASPSASPQPATLAPEGTVQEMRGLFKRTGVYHDPLLDAPVALEHVYRLELSPDANLESVAAQLRQRSNVAFVEPDYVAHEIATPDDPLYNQQWGLDKINAPTAWDVQTGGALVAVVDAGLQTDHPDLQGRLWSNPGEIADNGVDEDNNGFIDDVHGWNFYGGGDDLSDSTGHGTQVAGLIGATGDNDEGVSGVCWDCRLMVLKVIQPGGAANYSDIAAAIDYAVEKGADVINLSLGGYSDSATLRAAVGSAGDSVLVAGAGNDDGDAPFYPAAYEDVLAVTGTDDADLRVGNANYGAWVDLSAPGSSVLTTFSNGGYGEATGTSLAAPFTSGAAALLRAAYGWSPALVRAHLRQTSVPIDGANPGYEGLLGSGRLDAGAALNTTPQPKLVVQAIAIDGEPGGQPEPGTTVDLQVTLGNEWAPLGALQGTLTSNDGYATIDQDSASFEAMDTYASAQNSTPFRFTIASDAPYGHELALQLALREDGVTVQTLPVRVSVAQQTVDVSGLISSDTTWSGDRVYRLTGNTVVADGVTVTVKSGTRVEAESSLVLRVQGTLLASGMEEAPVVFTSASETPAPGDWQGLDVTDDGRIELTYCEVSYADVGIDSNTSSRPRHSIEDCFIHHNYVGVQAGSVTIRRSRLYYNTDVAIVGRDSTDVLESEIAYNGAGIGRSGHVLRNSIHNNQGVGLSDGIHVYSNTIVMNDIGIHVSRTPTATMPYYGNNLDRNRSYNARLNVSADLPFSHNWWGTTDLEVINDTIYDFEEDINVGIADVQPILTAPSTAAPAYFYDVAVDPDTTVGLQEVALDLKFSAPMDESIVPQTTLGLDTLIDGDDVPGWVDTQVNDVAVTSDGAIWLATGDGIIRFDGSEGTIYLEDQDGPFKLTVDADGVLWALSSIGLSRFNGTEWHFYSEYIYRWNGGALVSDPDGGIWLSECNYATYFDGETTTDYQLDQEIDLFLGCVRAMDTSSDGTLWIGTEERVYSFDGNQWTTYRPFEDYEEPGFRLAAMAVVDADEIWVVAEYGLLQYDSNEWIVHNPQIHLNYDWYNRVIEATSDGSVLAATAGHWAQYDGSEWTAKGQATSKNSWIRHVYAAADSSLWFGTDAGAAQLYETHVGGGQWLNENTFQATHQVTSLMPRGPYEVKVGGAIGAGGKETPPVRHAAFTVDYAGEVADGTPPPVPSLSVIGVNGDASAFSAQWSASDADSDIIAYRYAVGSTPGGREIVNWTTTSATSLTRDGFGFVEGQTYWLSLQAQNSGGLWSPTATSSFTAGQGFRYNYLPAIARQ